MDVNSSIFTNPTDVKNIARFANCIISFLYSYNIMLNEENVDHVANIVTASRYGQIVGKREEIVVSVIMQMVIFCPCKIYFALSDTV